MANVVVTMTGDELKLFKSLEKVIAQEKRVEQGFADVGKRAKQAGSDAEASFGSRALSGLKNYAAGMFTGAAAVAKMQEAMQFLRQESQQAIQSLKQLSDVNVKLNQVATSAADLARVQARADELAMQYGVEPARVRDLLFSGRSAGFESMVPDLLKWRQVMPPTEAALVSGKLPSLFQEVTGEQALNAVLAAAKASETDFAPMATSIVKSAEGAAPAGSSLAEAAAMASVLASSFASSDTMADRIKAFGARVSFNDKYKGLGIMGAFREIEKLPLSQQKKFIGGSQEVNAVFELLKTNADEIERQRDLIQREITETGTPQSEIAEGLARAAENPEQRAALQLERAAMEREVMRRQRMAQGGAAAQAELDRIAAQLDREERSGLAKFAGVQSAEATRLLTEKPEAIRGAGTFASTYAERTIESYSLRGSLDLVTLKPLTDALIAATRAMTQSADAQHRASQQASRRPQALSERHAHQE